MFPKSPVKREFARHLAIGVAVAAATVAIGRLPYNDVAQGLWVLGTAVVTAVWVLRSRLREDDDSRYTRVASKKFQYWIRHDPDLVQGLFASNVPRSVLEWFAREVGVRLTDCDAHHVVDSWARKDDPPGALVFRVGLELGRLVEAARAEGVADDELVAFLSERFSAIARESTSLLGREVAPGVFVRELRRGERRPAGVHICHPESRCLVVVESFPFGDGEITTVSLGLKKEDLAHLSATEWEALKEVLYEHFPYFRPSEGGSGPQKRRAPLFLAERPLRPDELASFAATVARAYESIRTRFGLGGPVEPEEPAEAVSAAH